MERIKMVHGMLVYVSCAKAVPAYKKAGAPLKPDEWKASVVITDEDIADELEELAGALQTQISLKKTKTSAFEATYKVAPPEDAGKNVWVFTVRKSTKKGGKLDAEDLPAKFRPKVFYRKGKTLTDITDTTLVGNGSQGAVSLAYFDMQNGTSISLKNVLVTDLVEYEEYEDEEGSAGSEFAEEGDEFEVPAKTAKKTETKKEKKEIAGSEFSEDDDEPEKPARKPAAKTTKRKEAEPEQQADDEDDEDSIPF